MQLVTENSKYQEFLTYMFRYYLTDHHKDGILYQDHFNDIQSGDMGRTNNSSKSINRGLKKFTTCGAKSLNTVFRSIYNFKTKYNKRMLCAKRKKKRNAKTIDKFNQIKDILSEFSDESLFRLKSS